MAYEKMTYTVLASLGPLIIIIPSVAAAAIGTSVAWMWVFSVLAAVFVGLAVGLATVDKDLWLVGPFVTALHILCVLVTKIAVPTVRSSKNRYQRSYWVVISAMLAIAICVACGGLIVAVVGF
jgi:hypothetical protein